jgi:hypothetical protein
MGSTSYSFESRSLRSESMGYFKKSADDIFEQNRKRVIHESMEPSKALLRESRDSEVHPLSVPIILALDVTGSMGKIPHDLVKDGLPTIMQGIIQRGILDPQILFLAIGDHEADRYPLQVGQFESGDLELDTWLTRTYIESGGGGNAGESYLLAWYYGAMHTVTDSFEKRGQKGFLFTIGDEPCLSSLPANVVNGLMGQKPQAAYKATDLLEMAQEKYNVFHLHVMEGSAGKRSLPYWKNLMGQNCIQVDNHTDIAKTIAEIVTSHTNMNVINTPNVTTTISSSPVNIIL